MKEKKIRTICFVLYLVFAVVGIASFIINGLYYKGFAWQEIVTFGLIIIASIMFFRSKTIKKHLLGGCLVGSCALIFNMYYWGFANLNVNNLGNIFNIIMASLIFLSLFFFIHAYLGIANLKKYAKIVYVSVGILLLTFAIYNISIGLIDQSINKNNPLAIFALIISNISLVCSFVVPLSLYLVLSSKED